MLALGVILIALAVLLAVGVAISSGHEATVDVFGVDLDVTASGIFFTGLVTGVAGVLGLWLLKKGAGRTYRRRKEVKELRQQVDETPSDRPGTTEATSKEETEAVAPRADDTAGPGTGPESEPDSAPSAPADGTRPEATR
jgi:hypothetical protein